MRYRLMKPSTTEGKPGSYYFDPLSTRYSDQTPSNTVQVPITALLVERFDLFTQKVYGSMNYMDMVLDFNGVAHRSELVVGNTLLVPTKTSMDTFIRKWAQE